MNDSSNDRHIHRCTDQLDIFVGYRCVDYNTPGSIAFCILCNDRRPHTIGNSTSDTHKNRHRCHVNDRLRNYLLRCKRVDRQHGICIAATDDRNIRSKNHGLYPFSHNDNTFRTVNFLRHFKIFRPELSGNSRQFFLIHKSSSCFSSIYPSTDIYLRLCTPYPFWTYPLLHYKLLFLSPSKQFFRRLSDLRPVS